MKQFSLEKWLQNKSRKVVTRSGHNVRILCTDQRGNMPIVALVEFETLDGVQIFYSDGKNESHREYDLFFADEEDGLTEFEKELQTIISEASHWTSDDGSISTYCQFGDKEIKKISVQILDLAKRELQPEFDKEMDKMLAETDKVVYQKGREDALKDLPKWRECEFVSVYPSIADTLGNAKLYYKNHRIDIKELIEKLPKEE